MVKHATFNRYNTGSNPVGLKEASINNWFFLLLSSYIILLRYIVTNKNELNF